MIADQNHTGTNKEPHEDGLSALRRLADLDAAGGDATPPYKSPQTSGVVEAIPDWLELLLAKYGEQASELLGIRPELSTAAQPIDLTASPPEDKEASEVASLLEQMAAGAGPEPRTERLATSVDWGEPTRHEDEMLEEQTADWLDRISPAPTPPPMPAVEEKTPDWPGQLDEESRLETEILTEPPEVPSRPVAEEEVPDWLQDISPLPGPADAVQPAEPAPPETAPSEAEVPDWLEDLSGYVPDSEGQQAEDMLYEPEAEVPDWMKELDMMVPSEAEGASLTSESEAPDWLKDLGVVPPLPEEGPPKGQKGPAPHEVSVTEETEGELPDWLARLADISASEAEKAPAVEPLPPELPPTPSPPKLAEAATQVEEEAPDWLHELESAEAEMPDWLRDLETAGEIPSAQPPASEVSLPATSEMAGAPLAEPEEAAADWPDRLKEVEEGPPVGPPSPKAALDVAAEEEAEVPDWLATLREETPSPLEAVAAGETPTPAYPVAEPVEEPEWLAELRVASKPDVLELDEEVIEAEEELPDWLAELRASQAAAEAPPVLEIPAKPIEVAETGELEEFYPPSEVEFAIPEIEVAPPPLAEMEPPPAEETEVLDWLAEIEAAALVPEYAEDETPPGEGEIPALQEEVPDWLRQMPPADLTTEAPIPESERETIETRRLPEWLVAEPIPGPSEEVLETPLSIEESLEAEEAAPAAEEIAPAEIPAWLLELKPEQAEPAGLREGEVVEPEDVLAGIPGLLPLAEEEPEIEEEPISALRSRIAVPEVPDVEGARLFREVVTERPDMEPMEAEPAPEARRGRIVETLVWAMVFIFLVAGILLALLAVLDRVGDLLGSSGFPEFFGSPLVIDPAPVNTFRAQVTRLPPDSVVVVAFDYGPATEAEMEPLAQIIVHDLLDNQARVIGVSLRPEGALMAQRLFGHFESEYPYGGRTINLGFMPGQTAGVRSLAFLASAPLFQDWTQTLNEHPAWQDVNSLEDVTLVVIIADSPLAIRWWIEQLGPGTKANRPMIAAVSAAADPSVRPYYNQLDPSSGQLLGLLSGVRDAAAYENRLGQPERAVKSLAAQSVAHLGLIVIGLGGAVAGFRMQASREE